MTANGVLGKKSGDPGVTEAKEVAGCAAEVSSRKVRSWTKKDTVGSCAAKGYAS